MKPCRVKRTLSQAALKDGLKLQVNSDQATKIFKHAGTDKPRLAVRIRYAVDGSIETKDGHFKLTAYSAPCSTGGAFNLADKYRISPVPAGLLNDLLTTPGQKSRQIVETDVALGDDINSDQRFDGVATITVTGRSPSQAKPRSLYLQKGCDQLASSERHMAAGFAPKPDKLSERAVEFSRRAAAKVGLGVAAGHAKTFLGEPQEVGAGGKATYTAQESWHQQHLCVDLMPTQTAFL